MIKRVLYISAFYLFFITNAFSAGPDINCKGLPFCDKTNEEIVSKVSGGIIGEMIKYVAVIAVISLMISGIMYLLSGGEEEKVKKAKTWIIWSLVGVFLSISAFTIIKIVNEISIG